MEPAAEVRESVEMFDLDFFLDIPIARHLPRPVLRDPEKNKNKIRTLNFIGPVLPTGRLPREFSFICLKYL